MPVSTSEHRSMRARFRTWWLTPPTHKDRSKALLVGAFAGFWLGGLGRLAFADASVSGPELLAYAGAGILVFAGVGYRYPKASLILLFPFAVFGTN